MVQVITDSLALANDLRPLLLRLARRLRQESLAHGISAGQVSLLAAIEAHPGISARELAERELVSAPAISAKLDALEVARLIERRREQGGDRRRVGLTLSREGRRVLRSVRRTRTVWLAERLAQLSEDEQAAIAAALGALERLAGEAAA